MKQNHAICINGGFWLPIYKNFEVINHVNQLQMTDGMHIIVEALKQNNLTLFMVL